MMLANIAYPDLTFNDTWLSLIYANVSLRMQQILDMYGNALWFYQLFASAENFQKNVDSYLSDIVPSRLVQLRQPFDIWKTIFPTEVNAFYEDQMNTICK